MIKRWLPIFIPLALFLVFLGSMAFIQFSTPNLPDNDGFYHIKLASLMRTEGLKPDFPWLPLSILNENEFYDHHFLFHVALIPFTFGDLRAGAKWAAVVFASLAFLAVWYLFHRQRIHLGWLWALALLGISDAFLFRMSITRAQSLSLGVLALGLTWMFEGKHKHLAILAFFYVWMYDAFPLLPILAVLHLVSVGLIEHRLEYRPLLYISTGIVLGMLINPYFPDNIIFSYRHMLPKLTEATSVSVGNEWYPYDTGQLLHNSLPALVAFASGIIALGLLGRKMDVRTGTGLLAALLFGLMLFQARRFVEYFPPFALIFAAFAWAPLISGPKPASVSPTRSNLWGALQHDMPVFLLAFTVIFTAGRAIPATQESIGKSKPYDLYEGASAWLQENTPPGERVFQTDWDDFPRLFFYNTHNTYLAGLDPTYMQLYDSESYDLWVLITRGKVDHPSQFIANRFNARFVHSDLKHGKFIDKAEKDPGLQEVYRDDQAVIFEVIRPFSDQENKGETVDISNSLQCDSAQRPHPQAENKWLKFDGNPVLGDELGTVFDISVLEEDGIFRMWFSWRSKASIALVESCDGVNWSKPVIVLEPDDTSDWEERVNRPVVLHQPDGYHMWYTGQTRENSYIGYATSPDGVTWKRVSDRPVLSPDQDWEKAAVMVPHVMWDSTKNIYKMWYSGGDQYEPDAIGYAESLDGQTWSKRLEPVFIPDKNSDWDNYKVTGGQVLCYEGWYTMFYIGFRNEHHAQIGVARSPDGIKGWERHPANPIIGPGTPNDWDADSVYKPYAVLSDNQWYLWFNGRSGSVEQIGLAIFTGADLGFGRTGEYPVKDTTVCNHAKS